MSIFLRKLWRNKPRQWGPVSRVQASLFHNVESIYEIDPNSFFVALPCWESGNPYNYAKNDRLPNHGATFEKNTLTFDDADISIPPFPYLACSVAFLGCTLANITTWQYLWHSCCDLISTDAIYGVKFQFIIDTGELAISYFDGGKAGPDHRRSKIGGSATTAKANYAGVINGYNDMDLYVNGSDVGGTYSGNATTYNAGPYWGAFGAATLQQTMNYGHFSVGTILVAKAAWLPSQIAALSDNPYGLWQRVAPVTYFVPGGTGGGIIPISGSLAASSGITANMSRLLAMAGELNSTTSISNYIKINRGLLGDLSASSNIVGTLSATRNLSGTLDAASSIDTPINIGRGLSGGLSANSNTQGQVSITRGLSGTLSASGDISAQLTLSGVVSLSGLLGATSDISASINALRFLSGSLTADAQADAQISAIRRLSGMLEADADIHGAITVTESGRVSLSGNISAMGAIQAALNIRRGLTGVVTANADAIGNINLTVAMSGSAEAIADLAGALSIVGESSLGVVIDPTITSVTTKRVLQSITIKRNINSI